MRLMIPPFIPVETYEEVLKLPRVVGCCGTCDARENNKNTVSWCQVHQLFVHTAMICANYRRDEKKVRSVLNATNNVADSLHPNNKNRGTRIY